MPLTKIRRRNVAVCGLFKGKGGIHGSMPHPTGTIWHRSNPTVFFSLNSASLRTRILVS